VGRGVCTILSFTLIFVQPKMRLMTRDDGGKPNDDFFYQKGEGGWAKKLYLMTKRGGWV